MEYTQNFTSNFGTIIIESIQMFWANLGTIVDRVLVLFGNHRAKESLEAKLYNISLISSEVADVTTFTHIATTICLWALLLLIVVWLIRKLFFSKKDRKNG